MVAIGYQKIFTKFLLMTNQQLREEAGTLLFCTVVLNLFSILVYKLVRYQYTFILIHFSSYVLLNIISTL